MADSGSHNFTRKLQDLNPSTISIQSLSKWMLFNYKAAAQLVRTWTKEFMILKPERKLVFMYLANDVMQQSRKKGKDFINEWQKVLPGVYFNIFKTCGGIPKTTTEAARLGQIWQERGMFEASFITELNNALKGTYTPSAEEITPASTPRGSSRTLSTSGAEPAIPPTVTSLGEILVRLGEHLKEAEKLQAQLAALPPACFAASDSHPEVPAGVTADALEMAAQMLGAERQVLEDCKREHQQALGKVRELLTTQMQQAQDNDAKIEANATKTNALAAVKEKLKDMPQNLHFKPPGGAAPPPPLADSEDEEEEEPSTKRQKTDAPSVA